MSSERSVTTNQPKPGEPRQDAPASVLADLRRSTGLTRAELASRVGVSRRAISYIERGERNPSPALAVLLAAALGCRPTDLGANPPRSIIESLHSATTAWLREGR